MRPYKARGIVLHTVKYGDTGMIAYLYTDLFGRKNYIINGIRSAKSKNNRAAIFQPMFLLDFEGMEMSHSDLHKMKDITMSVKLSSIVYNPVKSTIALFMAEVIYKLVREQDQNISLFEFINDSVTALENMEEGIANFHLWFLLRLTAFLGFYPSTDFYVENSFFDVKSGVFVMDQPSHMLFIDRNESRILYNISKCDISSLKNIKLSRGERNLFLNSLLVFIGYHFDSINSVNSLEILKEVFAENV